MRARMINEKFIEETDPIKDMGIGGVFDEDEPFLKELKSYLKDQYGYSNDQNYEFDFNYEYNENHKVIGVSGMISHNVDFEDGQGRHPWFEVKFTIDFKHSLVTVNGLIDSKDAGDLASYESESSIEEFNVEHIASIVTEMVDDASTTIYYEAEQIKYCVECERKIDDDDDEYDEDNGLCVYCRYDEDDDEEDDDEED
jgi:hypothetical protein